MAKNEDQFEDAPDPGEPPVVLPDDGEPTEENNEEGPEPQLIVDEETGKHYLAFEIEPPEEVDETEEGKEK